MSTIWNDNIIIICPGERPEKNVFPAQYTRLGVPYLQKQYLNSLSINEFNLIIVKKNKSKNIKNPGAIVERRQKYCPKSRTKIHSTPLGVSCIHNKTPEGAGPVF